jgi:hypothetical protein
MVDDHNHSARLCGLVRYELWASVTEEFAEAGYFFHTEIVRVWVFEESSLCAHSEDKFVAAVRLDLADPADEINSVGPAQASWQLAYE